MKKINTLYVKNGYQIGSEGEKTLQKHLETIELFHKIKEEYTEEEIEKLEVLLDYYQRYENKLQLKQMSTSATSWWRNELVNPTLEDSELWKIILRILCSGRYTSEPIHSKQTMDLFSKQLKGRIIEQIILGNEVELFYPTEENNLLTEAMAISHYQQSKRSSLFMFIKKNEIVVVKNKEKTCLYYSYQKIHKK